MCLLSLPANFEKTHCELMVVTDLEDQWSLTTISIWQNGINTGKKDQSIENGLISVDL